ncbi:hypothetical protein EVA_06792 [gut metagenome]|uniref:Uncharacterized protein n=1 Tax=gut metagenome TaxID=749906 RepID=J9GCP6_9ZZZZ
MRIFLAERADCSADREQRHFCNVACSNTHRIENFL